MIATVSTVSMEEKLLVALGAEDRAVGDSRGESGGFDGSADAVASGLVQSGVANDAAFTDVATSDLELRLHEDDHFAARGEQRGDGGNDERRRYEADVAAGEIDKLIAAFNPVEGRAIVVPTRKGKRGNPVLLGKQMFLELARVDGDSGARAVIAAHPDLVGETEMDTDSVLTDIDTPQALAKFKSTARPREVV